MPLVKLARKDEFSVSEWMLREKVLVWADKELLESMSSFSLLLRRLACVRRDGNELKITWDELSMSKRLYQRGLVKSGARGAEGSREPSLTSVIFVLTSCHGREEETGGRGWTSSTHTTGDPMGVAWWALALFHFICAHITIILKEIWL